MRASGILLPVFSLPSAYGIGCFSKEAYQFVDFLKQSGQTYWQILPLGPTGYGDSPYQSFSTFAGNPYYINLENLIEEGVLTKSECELADFGDDEEAVDYEKLYVEKFRILKLAYQRSAEKGYLDSPSYRAFLDRESGWIQDYGMYMAIKGHFEGKSWDQWEEEIRLRKPDAMARYQSELKEEIRFYQYLQYLFYVQWTALKTYANENGVRMIGDVPIYVAFDSADLWANPKLFQLDEKCIPLSVAGCPPDGFSADGQMWGNPLYEWGYHKDTGYQWWIQRISHCLELYDIVRIDHFRGFDEYYSIPYGERTAQNGRWMPGPGMDFFRVVQDKLGELPIIAEDLGFLTDTVKELLKESGYPGMKIIQFAFDSREENDYFPHNYVRNCVVYTGTHDNNTIQGWYDSIEKADKELALCYLNNRATPREELHWDYICLAMRSVADTCIIPMQDFLGLGSEARINQPSVLGNNWRWRMKQGVLTEELSDRIRKITEVCGRLKD